MNTRLQDVIARLRAGEVVRGYREGGNSMTPLIRHREPIDLAPVRAELLEKGDMVLVKVRGRIVTHKVTAVKKGQVQISNNHGHVNGWASWNSVFGIVVAVDGVRLRSALRKVSPIEESGNEP